MQFNAVVDVVIGLVVLFWIVATASSFLVEAISSFLNVRGRALELFVREMLVGSDAISNLRKLWTSAFWQWSKPAGERSSAAPADPGGLAVAIDRLDITDHPLVRRLAKPAASIAKPDTPPSYIPSDIFASAMLDRLQQIFGSLIAAADMARDLLAKADIPPEARRDIASSVTAAAGSLRVAQSIGELLRKLASATDRERAVANTLDALEGPARIAFGKLAEKLHSGGGWTELEKDPGAFVQSAWDDVRLALVTRPLTVADLTAIVSSGKLPESLAASLRPLLDEANHDMAALRLALQRWYDAVMDRASGWFRRDTQRWLFWIALGLAVVMNLDAIYIGQRLIGDRELRDAAVRVGETIVRHGEQGQKLTQMYVFGSTFRDGKWAAPLGGSDGQFSSAEALAMRVQPMLLNSGGFLGPMLALQAEALHLDGPCLKRADAAGCDERSRKERWQKQMEASQDALIAALCRSRTSRPADREWANSQSDKELIAKLKDPASKDPKLQVCATAFDDIRGNDSSALAAMGRLWSSSQMVWHTALGAAAWEVRLAGTGKDAEEQKAAAAKLNSAMYAAIEFVRVELQSVDHVLSRLPNLWIKGAIAYWSQAGYHLIVVSLVGWLITAFMASLGAPMWFDLLNKLVNRRITGPKPESTPAGAT